MCGQREETVMHIICECTKLAQKEYKRRHEWVGRVIHWELCKQLRFSHAGKWYEHKPESVLENEKSQLLWDFEVETDHHIEARRPDLIIVDKERNTCQIVDFAIPGDHRVEMKEKEKREKCQDLARELQVLWNNKISVIPILIGALGTVPKSLRKRLHQIGIQTEIETMQTTVLLNTARIIRKVLEL